MNKRIHARIAFLSILSIALSLTFVGCKKDAETKVTEETSVQTAIEDNTNKTIDTVNSISNTTETENKVEATEESKDATPDMTTDEKLDINALGFKLDNNLLYYNGTLLSANKIINYSIEKESAIFNNSDSSSIEINKDGDIKADFPVGITLKALSKFSSFEISYNDIKITVPSIINLTGNNDWYRLSLSDNINIRFNNEIIEVNIDDLQVSVNTISGNFKTQYKDSILSTSSIIAYNIENPIITLTYEDGSTLIHTIGGMTSYTMEDGQEILNSSLDKTINKIDSDDDNTLSNENISTEDAISNSEENVESKNADIISNNDVENINEQEIISDNQNLATIDNDMFNDVKFIENYEDAPNHIGVTGNYSFITGDINNVKNTSPLGIRASLLLEKELTTNISIGLDLGLGLNKYIDKNGIESNLKTFAPLFTFDYNFRQLNSKNSMIPYINAGAGCLIPVLEDINNTYFRARIGAGLKYNLNNNWMIKLGINYNFNIFSNDTLHEMEIPVGVIYKF